MANDKDNIFYVFLLKMQKPAKDIGKADDD